METQQPLENISYEEAKALLSQLMTVLQRPVAGPQAITIAKGMDDMLYEKMKLGLSHDTLQGFHLAFEYLGRVIDVENDISTISQETIKNFTELLSERGLKKGGINRRIREIRTFINFYKKRGHHFQPMEINQFKVESIPVYLSELKQNGILAAMKPEHREYIKLYLSTGARLNEIYNATLESDNYLVISAELCKTRKPIEIELSSENVIIYKNLMSSGLSSGRLSRLFKAACVKAGYPEHHFHHLRSTAGLMEYIRTGDIYRVSTMLHHSTVKTTESHYLVHSKRALRKDFQSLFEAKWPIEYNMSLDGHSLREWPFFHSPRAAGGIENQITVITVREKDGRKENRTHSQYLNSSPSSDITLLLEHITIFNIKSKTNKGDNTMARLRKLGRVYYARIRITTDEKQSERCINLGTREKAEASRRLMEIHRMEPALREGEDFEFSWQSKDEVTKIKRITIGDAVAQYLKARKNDLDSPLRESSYEMLEQSFNRLKRYLKWSRDIESLAQADIDGFKHYLRRKEFADATINITVRNLRTWYEWMKRKEIYNKPLVLKQIPIRGVKPVYVSNAEFKLILDSVDDYLKRVFTLYRDTGMRAKEPILGKIVGSFLIVSPEDSKSGREREVYLTERQSMTVREMQRKTHIEPRSQGADPTTHSHMYFTRQFKTACRKNGIKGKRLHSLRHTYALRSYLQERDLYSVAKKLGHSSLSVTQSYANFSMRRLVEDFPDIITHERGL